MTGLIIWIALMVPLTIVLTALGVYTIGTGKHDCTRVFGTSMVVVGILSLAYTIAVAFGLT